MPGPARPQLERLIVTPFTTIGVLAAVLTWEVEHAGSIPLAVAVAAGGEAIGVVVARQLRRDIEHVADRYAALLNTAAEQSRQADAANRPWFARKGGSASGMSSGSQVRAHAPIAGGTGPASASGLFYGDLAGSSTPDVGRRSPRAT